jgi:phosphoribosylformylglycinamidine synthase
MDLKEAGDLVYLVGEFQPVLGGSHYALLWPEEPVPDGPIPVAPAHAPETYRALHAAMRAGVVRACHDLSEGGLAAAAAEMCIGGRLGLEISEKLDIAAVSILFGETNGCLMVEVHASDQPAFESLLAGTAFCLLGTVTAEQRLSIANGSETLVNLPVEQLVHAWQR